MKIIALLPFKNEALMLPAYLSSVMQIADEIVGLDDYSSDDSTRILRDAGAVVIKSPFSASSKINMSKRRSVLLKEGRRRGGTHFIWLDADESFSTDFVPHARTHISKLVPGQKLTMRWVHVWGNAEHYLTDKRSPLGHIWKDFVSCDNGIEDFEDRFLSESRTPGSHEDLVELEEKDGVVLHFQFLDQNRVQLKQAWYRCVELLERNRSARRINHTYSHSLPNETLTATPIPKQWTSNLMLPMPQPASTDWHLLAILRMFQEYGITFFEPLEIWHIPQLRERFMQTVHRAPRSERYPSWLIGLHTLKRQLSHVF